MTPLRCVSCGADLIDEARFFHRCGHVAGVVEVIDLTRDDRGVGPVDARPRRRQAGVVRPARSWWSGHSRC